MVEKRFEKLGMPDIERFENYLPTAFNSELTLLQKVNKIIFDLIETNKLTNEMVDYLNQFIETFDEKLYKTISDVLQVWLEDGRLADVVRVAISEEVIEARTDHLGQTYLTLKERLDLERKEVIEARGDDYQTLGERLDSEKADVIAQLSQISSQTYDVFNISAGGADGSGRDVTEIIQTALNENDSVYIPNGEHYISNTIVIPFGKELIFAKRAVLRLTNVNKNAIQLKNKAKLINPTIFLPQGHTGAGIYISSSDGIALDTIMENVYIHGGGAGSTGIYYEAITSNSYIYYTTIRRVYIQTCGKAIHFKKDDNVTGFINSNVVSDVTTYQCAYHIYLEGRVQANQFENFRMQWTNSVVPNVYGVYCEGVHNTFNGRAWDFKDGSLAYYFTVRSLSNVVHYSNYLNEAIFKDDGLYNVIMQPLTDTLDNTIVTPNVHQQGQVVNGNRYNIPFTYAGNQDDILSYADRRYTVRNLGKSILTGTFNDIFDPYTKQSEGVYYKEPTKAYPAIIEIDMGESSLLNVPFIGISFSTMAIAEDFSVEIAAADEYRAPIYVTGNNKSHYNVFFDGGNISINIRKIRISITKAKFSETVNTSKFVIVKRIFSVSMQEAGHAFLPRGGGQLYGDIKFSSNKGAVLESPNGSKFRLSVDDSGIVSSIQI